LELAGDLETCPGNDLDQVASAAWLTLGLTSQQPERVQLLSLKNKSSVHRLVYRNRSSIIAKRCQHWGLRVERTIYERVLFQLSIKSPAYLGCLEEENGDYYWLFLEESRGIAFDASTIEHQLLAANWLAQLHGATAKPSIQRRLPRQGAEHFVSKPNGAANQLPDRGTNYYRTALEKSICAILPSAINPQYSVEQRKLLKTILKLLDAAEKYWPQLERTCNLAPRVISHGDFVAKNLRVQFTPNASLIAFDWESAGWASPAMDFSLLEYAEDTAIGTYCRNFGDGWPGIEPATVRCLINAGVICRTIASIYWQCECLEDPTTWHDLETYATKLPPALRQLLQPPCSLTLKSPDARVDSKTVHTADCTNKNADTEPIRS
jgi:phosphotransferase family enzyme